MYVGRQLQSGSHQYGGSPHGNTGKVNRNIASAAFNLPIQPVQTVKAFGKAEAHIFATAVILPTLLNIEHAAVVFVPEIGDHPKIPMPR